MAKPLSDKTKAVIARAQHTEITEHIIYQKLAQVEKDRHNRDLLTEIAADELKHYQFWQKFTGAAVKPNLIKVWIYYLIARILGLTFGLKLMERGEEEAQATYQKIAPEVPQAVGIVAEEDVHEEKLLHIINEERLRYIGSIVLGLNDALVELTGALAGFTFALGKAPLIATAGLITGMAASLSMAASEYLSKAQEGERQTALRAAFYTGLAYVATVLFLISPYAFVGSVYLALGVTLVNAMIVIAAFTAYTAVAQDQPFFRRFAEMAAISLGVASLTFLLGIIVRRVFGIEI